jgi:hypothetical protein
MISAADATLTAIQSMQGTLQVAAALLHAGRPIELAGLEVEAARICAAVGLLPPGDARPLRPALEALVVDLDRLAAALQPASGPGPV